MINSQRIIGRYTNHNDGPLIICIGGIHGNESSGVLAIKSVLEELKKIKPPFKGELLALAGNITALSGGIRYIDEDLNRIWTTKRIETLEKAVPLFEESVEETEQRELFKMIKDALDSRKRLVYVLDLHTTSSESVPFVTIADTLRNRHSALEFPVPIVLGLEEVIEGTLLNYINELGFIAIGFEAGQHNALSSIENHIAVIWMILSHAHCIDPGNIPDFDKHDKALLNSAKNGHKSTQKIFEVRYRYSIEKNENFVMNPGFINFQKIKKGQLLARSQKEKIHASENGEILMPLYQKQGDDGFFIVREIRPFWLKVSAIMRKLKLERILPYLPGINRHPEAENSLIVNSKIARWHVIEIFHLLGYRRKRGENGRLIVTKRKYDIYGPDDYKKGI